VVVAAVLFGPAVIRSIRFQKEGAIIVDRSTNLEWRVGPDNGTDWNDAGDWVESLGGSWRMPTRAELQELYDAGIREDDWGLFENGGYFVWSSEVRDSSSAWGFSFYHCYEYWIPRDFDNNLRAFAVRPRG